jgi:hypothetical protein
MATLAAGSTARGAVASSSERWRWWRAGTGGTGGSDSRGSLATKLGRREVARREKPLKPPEVK